MTYNPGTKYKDCYLVYARRSTDDPDNQKNSIPYQRVEGVRFAKREHLSIAPLDIEGLCKTGIISERHTGFKEDDYFNIRPDGRIEFKIERPKFAKLVQYLHQGCFKGVIFLCWDRASRNENDDNIIKKLIRLGIDIRFVQTEYEDSSSGALHMDIDGTFARHHSRVTSEKVRNTTRRLREDGVCTYRAPVGYLNSGDLRNKPFDPERAPIIKQLFEKYAEGTWSLHDLARWANAQGLTMPPTRRKRTKEEKLLDEEDEITIEPISRPITFKHVHYILKNKFYIGLTIGPDKKTHIPSISHQPLVDPALFDKVQRTLKSKKVSVHYIDKPFFTYRGLIRCGTCRRVYTPYEQKGIHYYGARCMENCTNTKRSINTTFIETGLDEILSQLQFTTRQFLEIDQRLGDDLPRLEKEWQANIEQHDRREKKLLEDLSYLRENKLTLIKTGVYSPEEYIQAEQRLSGEIETVQQARQKETSLQEFLKDVEILSELLKTFYYHYIIAKEDEKAELLSCVFSELFVSEERLKYQCKKGLSVFEKPFFLTSAVDTWISELYTYHQEMKATIEELRNVL